MLKLSEDSRRLKSQFFLISEVSEIRKLVKLFWYKNPQQ